MEGSRSMVAKYEHFDDPSVIDRTEIRYVQREEPRAVPSRVNTNIYQQQGSGRAAIKAFDGQKPKIKIVTYNESSPWSLSNFFSCCKKVETVDFEDCQVCNRRVYLRQNTVPTQKPYISAIRMDSRQKQPIRIYYDQLANHSVANPRLADLNLKTLKSGSTEQQSILKP